MIIGNGYHHQKREEENVNRNQEKNVKRDHTTLHYILFIYLKGMRNGNEY